MERRAFLGLLALLAVGCSAPDQSASTKEYDQAMAKAEAMVASHAAAKNAPKPVLVGSKVQPVADAPAPAVESSAPSAGTGSIEGFWQGKVEMPKPKEGEEFGAALAQGMAGAMAGMMTLEFTDRTFKLTLMGMPVEGNYVRKGSKLTLQPARVMGLSASEYKRQNPKAKMEPVYGNVSADGKTIELLNDGPVEEQGKMIFVRAEKPASSARPDTLKSDDERALVGTFQADVEASDLGPESRANAQEAAAARMVLSGVKLELRPDRTFTLNLMLALEGNWSLRGDVLNLNPTGISGMPKGGNFEASGDPMDFRVSPDRSVLLLKSNDRKNPGQLVLRRVQ